MQGVMQCKAESWLPLAFLAAGTISNKEARDALRLHKGNVWSAVTECVEQRRKKVRSESKHRRRVFPSIGLTASVSLPTLTYTMNCN